MKNYTVKSKCVECGSNEVISKGISWYCKSCGRWFIKKPRKDFYKRIAEHVKDNLGMESFGVLINGYNSEVLNKIAEKFNVEPIQVINALKLYLTS